MNKLNEHDAKEHADKLARDKKAASAAPKTSQNAHNAKEHADKLAREKA
jgi:hypothetical protein